MSYFLLSQLVEDINDVEHLQPGLSTGPVLFASEENPILLPLIQRGLKMPGDVELVIINQHRIELLLNRFQATEYVQGTSGIERTRLLAKEYACNARDVLRLLPESDTKLALEALTDIVIEPAR